MNNLSENHRPSRWGKEQRIGALILALHVIAALAAGIWIYRLEGRPATEDMGWFSSYFSHNTTNELSKAQLDILNNSAEVTSAVAEDAGVTITLNAVTGDGYDTYYKLDISFPEDIAPVNGYHFGKALLLLNDNVGLFYTGYSAMTLDDEAEAGHHVLLLSTHMEDFTPEPTYYFDNGIVRTLHLEDIMIADENGKPVTAIEGQWEFGIVITRAARRVELVDEPVSVSGYDGWHQIEYRAQVTSFTLSEFSALCTYEMPSDAQGGKFGMIPTVVMKDGSIYRLMPNGGSGSYYHYTLNVPISLDEADYVRLTDDVTLQIPAS